MVSSRAPLRIVFFGTPAFAVPSLEALLRSHHEVVAVVTQPDRPRGRGQRVSDAPVKAAAVAAGLPVLQPDRLGRDQFEAPFAALGADLGVVAAYGKILPEWLLQAPRLGMINVHASLLPRYRGASPVHHAVMHGDTETGVTIMRVVKALDAGAMITKVTRPIGPDETSAEVEAGLAALGAGALIEAVDALAAGTAVETPQDDALATYAPRLTREHGVIDWTRPARAIHDQVRGLHPWPHAFTVIDGQRLIIHHAALAATEPGAPGDVHATRDHLRIVCGDGATLELTAIQPEGRRVMSARDFLAGRALPAGARAGAA
ncbi:MAG: methionyl-tRNA formyltransferase [Vicinamibacterales bacterium]